MRRYRKAAQLAYAALVVATIWLRSTASAEARYNPILNATKLEAATSTQP